MPVRTRDAVLPLRSPHRNRKERPMSRSRQGRKNGPPPQRPACAPGSMPRIRRTAELLSAFVVLLLPIGTPGLGTADTYQPAPRPQQAPVGSLVIVGGGPLPDCVRGRFL